MRAGACRSGQRRCALRCVHESVRSVTTFGRVAARRSVWVWFADRLLHELKENEERVPWFPIAVIAIVGANVWRIVQAQAGLKAPVTVVRSAHEAPFSKQEQRWSCGCWRGWFTVTSWPFTSVSVTHGVLSLPFQIKSFAGANVKIADLTGAAVRKTLLFVQVRLETADAAVLVWMRPEAAAGFLGSLPLDPATSVCP